MMPENPFAPARRDGKLTPERWLGLNALITHTDALRHDELITGLSCAWGISRRRLKAEIKTYRLHSPEMLQ